MTHGPLVSIILPVCNGEPHIGATLDSALGQTYRPIELIVVDDGSRDRTREIVDARAKGDARIRLIAQANRGVAAARNRALDAARGEFVASLDADDVWQSTKIERQVLRMLEVGDTFGLVYCWWTWIDADGRVLDRSPEWRIQGDAFETLLQVNYIGSASVPLYRRACLQEVSGYDTTLRDRDAEGCEDWDVALKVAERWRVAVVPAVLVGYRRRRDSMSSRTSEMWRSHALVTDGVRQRRPELRAALIRRSHDQFALHLAGVSFWSGAYGRAIGWGLRAWRSTLALQVLPYVMRLFVNKLRRTTKRREPLIPYDRIYRRRLAR